MLYLGVVQRQVYMVQENKALKHVNTNTHLQLRQTLSWPKKLLLYPCMEVDEILTTAYAMRDCARLQQIQPLCTLRNGPSSSSTLTVECHQMQLQEAWIRLFFSMERV